MEKEPVMKGDFLEHEYNPTKVSKLDILRIKKIVDEMHKIVFPGEYGCGETYVEETDKFAWEKLGELIEILMVLLDKEKMEELANAVGNAAIALYHLIETKKEMGEKVEHLEAQQKMVADLSGALFDVVNN